MENLASQYTVLVVDDVPTNVMLVQAILKKEGYTLLTTDSGAKALRIAQERHPNLILLDIMMPEMDGYTGAGGCEIYVANEEDRKSTRLNSSHAT